jgi:type II secretory pathway predicted ATPase ExeA
VSLDKLCSYFGFTRTPFRRDLSPAMLHRHTGHAEAVARIRWCVNENALAVITGEVGAGKTVALRAALADLDASRHTVIYLPNPAVGARGIYTAIVSGLGATPRFHTAALIAQTTDLLAAEKHERGRAVIVAVDEAHLLSPTQLEELRLLTNSEMDSVAPFTGLLLGQPTLRRRIKSGQFAALDQRVALRYALPGMTPTETREYLTHTPPETRRPRRSTLLRRRRRPDPPDQPRTPTSDQQHRPTSPRRDLRHQQNDRRRVRHPRRRHRSHRRITPTIKTPH